MTDLLLTTDLSNATKEQLKSLVKTVRESWGKVIDLRKADVISLRQYLQDYLTKYLSEQATEPEVEEVAPEPTEPSEEQDDVIGGAAASVTDAIFTEAEATVSVAGSLTIIAEVKEAVAPEIEVTPTIIEEIATVNVIPAQLPEPMTEAKTDVTTWITLLYAGTPELPAGHVADINLITRLFPAFSGDWEGLRKQIAYRVQPDSDELVEGQFYGAERLDHKDLFAHILPNLAWLRQVEDDEVFVFRQISEFEGIDDLSMGDWWVSSPLTCDVNNYQYCLLPDKKTMQAVQPTSPATIGLCVLTAIAEVQSGVQPWLNIR